MLYNACIEPNILLVKKSKFTRLNYILGLKLYNEDFILKIMISLHATELKIVVGISSCWI